MRSASKSFPRSKRQRFIQPPPKCPPRTQAFPMSEAITALIFFAFFPLWTYFILKVMRPFVLGQLALFSGWRALAEHYRGDDWERADFRFQSAKFGSVSISGALEIAADNAHLRFNPIWGFRVHHPPLRIPWGDVTAKLRPSLFGSRLILSFAKEPNVTVFLSRKLGRKLEEASSGAFAMPSAK